VEQVSATWLPQVREARAAGDEATSVREARAARSMISIEDLSVRLPRKGEHDHLVLRKVSFDVKDGELLTIVGASGCGKTTLLRTIAGLLPASSGAVRIGGTVVNGPSRKVAMVFQEFALLPWRSVLRNVEFPLEATKLSKKERRLRAERALAEVQLLPMKDLLPGQLSGGMKQRVGLARALATDADVLLMDEPFGAVDPQVRRLLQASLLELWAETGKTIVFVTHDIDEAVLLSDRVCCLGAGAAGIREMVQIDIPRPRLTDELEIAHDLETARYRHNIWRLLSPDIRSAGGVAAPANGAERGP
jgi:NitT/TauT family transport system ATP-binding protein